MKFLVYITALTLQISAFAAADRTPTADLQKILESDQGHKYSFAFRELHDRLDENRNPTGNVRESTFRKNKYGDIVQSLLNFVGWNPNALAELHAIGRDYNYYLGLINEVELYRTKTNEINNLIIAKARLNILALELKMEQSSQTYEASDLNGTRAYCWALLSGCSSRSKVLPLEKARLILKCRYYPTGNKEEAKQTAKNLLREFLRVNPHKRDDIERALCTDTQTRKKSRVEWKPSAVPKLNHKSAQSREVRGEADELNILLEQLMKEIEEGGAPAGFDAIQNLSSARTDIDDFSSSTFMVSSTTHNSNSSSSIFPRQRIKWGSGLLRGKAPVPVTEMTKVEGDFESDADSSSSFLISPAHPVGIPKFFGEDRSFLPFKSVTSQIITGEEENSDSDEILISAPINRKRKSIIESSSEEDDNEEDDSVTEQLYSEDEDEDEDEDNEIYSTVGRSSFGSSSAAEISRAEKNQLIEATLIRLIGPKESWEDVGLGELTHEEIASKAGHGLQKWDVTKYIKDNAQELKTYERQDLTQKEITDERIRTALEAEVRRIEKNPGEKPLTQAQIAKNLGLSNAVVTHYIDRVENPYKGLRKRQDQYRKDRIKEALERAKERGKRRPTYPEIAEMAGAGINASMVSHYVSEYAPQYKLPTSGEKALPLTQAQKDQIVRLLTANKKTPHKDVAKEVERLTSTPCKSTQVSKFVDLHRPDLKKHRLESYGRRPVDEIERSDQQIMELIDRNRSITNEEIYSAFPEITDRMLNAFYKRHRDYQPTKR